MRRKADRNFWTQTGVIPRWQLLAVYLTIVAAGVIGFWQTSSVANRADDLARDVRDSRMQAIITTCQQQNDRNAEIVRTIRDLNPRVKLGVAQRFADSIAPRFDCKKRAKELE